MFILFIFNIVFSFPFIFIAIASYSLLLLPLIFNSISMLALVFGCFSKENKRTVSPLALKKIFGSAAVSKQEYMSLKASRIYPVSIHKWNGKFLVRFRNAFPNMDFHVGLMMFGVLALLCSHCFFLICKTSTVEK